MLKFLNKDATKISPFIVTKNWELSNTNNCDLILMEHSGSDGPSIVLEYLEYNQSFPVSSSGQCSISLEKQYSDKLKSRVGKNITGLFDPIKDPQNRDGTYQRLIYSQIFDMFYNKYKNPIEIWGLEQLDFELSQTNRFITNEFLLFDIPQKIFGEKMINDSIQLLQFSDRDNNYYITDDGNCNLLAGFNIFTKEQEIGYFINNFTSGSNSNCNYYQSL